MDRARKAQPHANEAVWTREVSRQLESHLTRINHAQPSIDTSVPKTATNIPTASKKYQLREERLDAIELENRRLLDRIASIALSTSKDSLDGHPTPNAKKSLHEGLRKREQHKIWLENQALLKRLQSAKSTMKPAGDAKKAKWKLKFVKSKEHKLTAQDNLELQKELENHAAKPEKPRHKKGKPSNKVFIDNEAARPQSVSGVASTSVKFPQLQSDTHHSDKPAPLKTKSTIQATQPHCEGSDGEGASTTPAGSDGYTLPSIIQAAPTQGAPASSPSDSWAALSPLTSPAPPTSSSRGKDDDLDAQLLLPLISPDQNEDWIEVIATPAPMGYSRENSTVHGKLDRIESPPQEVTPVEHGQLSNDTTVDEVDNHPALKSSIEPTSLNDISGRSATNSPRGVAADAQKAFDDDDPTNCTDKSSILGDIASHLDETAKSNDAANAHQVDLTKAGSPDAPSSRSDNQHPGISHDKDLNNPTAFLMRSDSLTSSLLKRPGNAGQDVLLIKVTSPVEYLAMDQGDFKQSSGDSSAPAAQVVTADEYIDEFEADATQAVALKGPGEAKHSVEKGELGAVTDQVGTTATSPVETVDASGNTMEASDAPYAAHQAKQPPPTDNQRVASEGSALHPTAFLMRSDSFTSGQLRLPGNLVNEVPTPAIASPVEYFSPNDDDFEPDSPTSIAPRTFASEGDDGRDYNDEFEEDANNLTRDLDTAFDPNTSALLRSALTKETFEGNNAADDNSVAYDQDEEFEQAEASQGSAAASAASPAADTPPAQVAKEDVTPMGELLQEQTVIPSDAVATSKPPAVTAVENADGSEAYANEVEEFEDKARPAATSEEEPAQSLTADDEDAAYGRDEEFEQAEAPQRCDPEADTPAEHTGTELNAATGHIHTVAVSLVAGATDEAIKKSALDMNIHTHAGEDSPVHYNANGPSTNMGKHEMLSVEIPRQSTALLAEPPRESPTSSSDTSAASIQPVPSGDNPSQGESPHSREPADSTSEKEGLGRQRNHASDSLLKDSTHDDPTNASEERRRPLEEKSSPTDYDYEDEEAPSNDSAPPSTLMSSPSDPGCNVKAPLEVALDYSSAQDDDFEPESPTGKSPRPPSPLFHDETDHDYHDEFDDEVGPSKAQPPDEDAIVAASSVEPEQSPTKQHEYYDDDFDNN